MTIEEYLKNNKAVSLTEVAKIMFPKNKTGALYLSNKLNKTANRSFTRKDAEKAIKALDELYGVINYLTIE